MIDAVVANFIDSVGEREFDAAFMALLRSRGFYDIHFTHGNYEFGSPKLPMTPEAIAVHHIDNLDAKGRIPTPRRIAKRKGAKGLT